VPIVVLWAVLSSCSSSEVTQTGSNPGRSDRGRAGGDRTVESRAISIRAYRAKREPISTYIVSNTTLEAIRKVTVYARLNAIIEEIMVEEGAFVGEGDVLLRLEDREVRNEYEQASIAVDEANLGLRQGEVQVQLSAADYERSLDLFEQRLISKQEFDQVTLTNRIDGLALETAHQRLEAARARLRAATIQLEYTEIPSPIDGVITERLVEVGDRVNGNEEVFSVEEFPPLWARIFVPERDLPQLKVAQKAQVRVDTFPDQDFEATIKLINPTVDATSGTVKVTFEMERTDRLRPGMFGTVYIATETRPDAIVIPKKAVLRERDENRVFVITAENLVEKREVVLGFSEEDRVEILEGIQEGEDIVTVGYEGLADGYAVNIISWEGTPPQEGPYVSAAPERTSSPTRSDGPDGTQSAQTRDRPPRQQMRGGPPASGGPGGQREMSPEMVERFMDRLMNNPEIKKEYEVRLAKDPELATDFEKQRAFAQEMMQLHRGHRGRP
ncbi:MAG: efflux RND transporter periplasmic adaptor subunit, partial [Acidobacteria bacterium]|nr:efflux RND transporter periplasmic adaptor subunit [Acidobacteriota bacterium]